MTLPYLPGWGDTMAKYLPQIGQNVQESFLPHISRQKELMKMLTEDPEKINQFIEMERTNPGSTQGLFGKKTGGTIAQRDFTPEYKTEKKRKEAGASIAEAQLQKLKDDLAKDAEDKAIMGELAIKDPKGYAEITSRGAQARQTGTTLDAVAEAKFRLHKMESDTAADDNAKTFLGKFKTMDEAIAGLDTEEPDKIGAILSAPSAEALKLKWQEKMAKDREDAYALRQAANIEAQSARDDKRIRAREGEAQARIDALNGKQSAVYDALVVRMISDWNKFTLKNKNPSEEQAQAQVSEINSLLEKQAELTGKVRRAVFVKRGGAWDRNFGGANKTNTIQIMGADGVEGSIEQPTRIPPAVPGLLGQTSAPSDGSRTRNTPTTPIAPKETDITKMTFEQRRDAAAAEYQAIPNHTREDMDRIAAKYHLEKK